MGGGSALDAGQIGTGGDIDHERHIQGNHSLHGCHHKFLRDLDLVEWALQDQLVVDLEDQCGGHRLRIGALASRSIIAFLMMSAEVPCTGAFSAIRSPIWRIRKLSDFNSGR